MKVPALLIPLFVPASTFALNITLDFTHDDYFTNASNPYGETGRAALQAAADEISSLISTSLNAVESDVFVGTSGSTTAALGTSYTFVNPSAPSSSVERSPIGIAADEIVVYVGASSLQGLTFAQASPGSPTLRIKGIGSNEEWTEAVAIAESQLNDVYGRGDYDIQRIATTTSFGEASANIDLHFGPVLGSMWFDDSPSGASTERESWEVNNDYWHFNHTTPVESGKVDVYSTAMHELLHVLGYGTSEEWGKLVFGEDWNGANVIEILETGEGVLSKDGDHILDGFLSPGYKDGELGSPVLSPTIAPSDRLQITELDIAFLEDSGYEIAAIPEPSAQALLLFGAFALGRRRR